MGVAVRPRADDGRSRLHFVKSSGNRATGPATAEFIGGGANGCPELDCVRPLLPTNVIEDAAHRAAVLGVGADRVLIAAGTLSEEAYLRALGKRLDVAFAPLDDTPRALCPLNDERLIETAAAGMLPLTIDDQPALVVAPRGAAVRRILQLIDENPARARLFHFTTAERLNCFVLRHADTALAARATDSLKRKWPVLSAAPPRWRTNIPSVAAIMLPALAAFVMAPAGTMLVFEAMLAAMFLAWLGLRLAGACMKNLVPNPSPGLPDDALPVYTVIAALYREAASVDGLLRAIEHLEYTAEKLDAIIVVEADDYETRAAVAARKARVPVTVIPVPTRGPRTKPKALNVALPFARGAFTVIYDAEDRPEPNQLRRALQAFRAGGSDLACVQARLCIDNSADSWLAQLFTAEYAGQFDVFLPGLAALRLPLPLGGSSNHFYGIR
jgi:hypothetical protein